MDLSPVDEGRPELFQTAVNREWWLGNAMGGWASGTVAGAHTRKYHGLLVAAQDENRWLLLSKMEETAIVGGQRIDLGCNFYPNAIHPDGWSRIGRFSFDGAVARWTYEVAGRRLGKEVWCAHGHNTTFIRYTLLEGDQLGLEAWPLVSGRAAHGIGLPPQMRDGTWVDQYEERRVDWDLPLEWSISCDDGMFRPRPDTYQRFIYPMEQERGEAHMEDLRTPGAFELLLREGHHVTLTASAEGPDLPGPGEPEVASHRLQRLVEEFRAYNKLGPQPLLEALVRASDAFIIRQGRRYDIIAGYPYFGRWCRDAMISVPGLCIYTGRHALARDVIENWMDYLRQGMLPSHFNSNNEPVYAGADGTLWMFWAVSQLDDEGGLTSDVLARWWPALRNALREHIAGNEKMHLDGDGLLALHGQRLTWMDAADDGRALTPREGKRVEINALWTHALARAGAWAVRAQDNGSAHLFGEAAQTARNGMAKFYNDYAHYLDDGIEPTDGRLRPNQLWALALPDVGISTMQARQALGTVRQKLLLPGAGLQTLAPGEPEYNGHYGGSQSERDRAYHQGAAWPWLLGAYCSATALLYPNHMQDARKALEALLDPQRTGAMLGLAEVHDPDSRQPAGCPLQAWSVAECLRAGVLAERMRRHWGLAHATAETGRARREGL